MAVIEDLKVQEETSPRPEEKKQKPQLWKWSVIFLCLYGFMAQLKPGDSFITPLLLSLEKNFTREEIIGFGIVLPLHEHPLQLMPSVISLLASY
ncbi:UNVERIFIED_CONTAM: hypothetical protein FKN15_040898 [Acipenser sinensis]